MKYKESIFKIIFSSCFFILAILTMCFEWFKNNINGTVIVLIIIGFLPWVIKYIKSFEAFGMKAELFTNTEKSEAKKLLKDNKSELSSKLENAGNNKKGNNIVEISIENPIEKVVHIRVEIEKLLKELVKEYGMESSHNPMNNMDKLNMKNIISNNRLHLIKTTMNIISRILHKGLDSVSNDDLIWAIQIGESTIEMLKADIEFKKYFPNGIDIE